VNVSAANDFFIVDILVVSFIPFENSICLRLLGRIA
jgi:hypothetical protein